MNVFKKVKFLDSISSMLVSALLCILLYKILYPIWHYTGLKDFYSGTTVFENHNKILDIVIYFIYLSLFFAVLPLITTIREKFLPDCRFFIDKFVTISKRISNKLTFPEKLSKFFAKYQIITVIFYILLYPFDGNFYPMVSGIIVLLIVAALIDVKKRSNSEYKISPWTLAPLLLALLFKNYYIPAAPVDDHHLGETFSTFFMHDKYNLQYFKDIMLMHGYTDILPAFFGKYLFGDSNLYSYCLGGVFFDNLKLLAIIISGLYFFKKTPLFVAPLLIVNFSFPHVYNSCLYMVSFLLLLQKKILKKPLLWLVLYLILCFAGFVYWTTFGTFWIISSLPIAGYVIWKSNRKLVNFSVLA
ncbi:MAG: hypothetical protein LUG16_04080, partial [Candidatus Gastranaerophilales bacterium]|nr:hypothetical protein [Candidatus Gastranaerophilales bacterium]